MSSYVVVISISSRVLMMSGVLNLKWDGCCFVAELNFCLIFLQYISTGLSYGEYTGRYLVNASTRSFYFTIQE